MTLYLSRGSAGLVVAVEPSDDVVGLGQAALVTKGNVNANTAVNNLLLAL